jgi:hypothetical protein
MYCKRKTEARSRNYFWGGKAISVAHSEFVAIDLGTEHAMRMRDIVICGVSGYTIFLHII